MILKQIQHNGESFIYIDVPRKDVKLVGLRPLSDTIVKVLTVYPNDEVIVRKQQTDPKLTRRLIGMRESVLKWITNGDVAKLPTSCGNCGGCGKVRYFVDGKWVNQTCSSCGGSGKK